MQKTRMSICNVKHWFGPNRVLHDINLDIKAGDIVALVGPSGCGKSTLLRACVGTHPPKKGNIFTDQSSKSVTRPTRDIGIVYQRYSLFPFLRAQDSVALGPILDKTTPWNRLNVFKYRAFKKQILEEAEQLLEKVGLSAAMHTYPHQLSGGMRQRVAIAQALIMKPRILLLDEPFGALDEAMREELQRMLLHLYQENQQAILRGEEPPYTILMVTHELNEALYVSNRIVGLSQYWDWQKDYMSCPGATIVYDEPAPIFLPDDIKDYESFAEQKKEIRKLVFHYH